MRKNCRRNNRKILISAYTGLGHFILKTVLIQKLNEMEPDCRIIIIAGNDYGTESVTHKYPVIKLDEKSSFINKIFFFIKLRKEKIDVAILPVDSAPPFLIRGCILASIPVRLGNYFPEDSPHEYYYTRNVPIKLRSERSELDLSYDLLEALFEKQIKRDFRLELSSNDSRDTNEKYELDNNKYICLQPGGANGNLTTKRWHVDRFKELIKLLLRDFPDLRIFILGDKNEIALNNEVVVNISDSRIINHTGKISIQELKLFIANAAMLICHDSSLLHLGNAYNVKTVGIYGPSDPDVYTHFKPNCHIVRNKVECSPCQGLFPGRYDLTEAEAYYQCPEPECMKVITVEMVFNKCKELLSSQ